MQAIRIKPEEFRLENFINYYKDNCDELLYDYPDYVSRVCLIDRDYMDVITFDEDYEDINDASDYANLLLGEEYALHFAIGKTNEDLDKVEFLDGKIYNLRSYGDDEYEDYNIRDIGDFRLDLNNLVGLTLDFDYEDKEIVISSVNFEHGGELATPRIIEVEDSGDLEKVIVNFIERFIIKE
ncbi:MULTISPECIES: hypothetical protein [Romboutsia]|uniref:Uncharacterized protein n=1 Tax=Romboutsia hominis TaxID=1507512 RepID=A0A2P2BRA4_9FIRM|nr:MULTISPECIES: hypothetical protein [Romboutsia]MDB8794063.1 hypothetical protein [Romboutsia sp. 1001216sp1]MDB8796391.1 hypothetical protein [Romboutsia sp. 1001216sp1]MDB8797856.1 hypothetical protein [Romboutsia sp. 1001216sp1]MDB8804987.1 hypothetical protein [Romboutsia sp. 1001216sp1]MDB8807977.1 hypothetical protein [Romboutsia sp. 1001216sp1]